MFGIDNSNTQSANGAVPQPAAPVMHPITGQAVSDLATSPVPPPPAPAGDDLLALKQKALSALEPMVGKLEQSPDEKFKTLMMLIQASDNAGLLPEAYATAEKITDERERAQALIDVVNEINYFTQHPKP